MGMPVYGVFNNHPRKIQLTLFLSETSDLSLPIWAVESLDLWKIVDLWTFAERFRVKTSRLLVGRGGVALSQYRRAVVRNDYAVDARF